MILQGSAVGLEGLHNAEHEAEIKADQEKFERRAGVLTYVGQSCLDDDTSMCVCVCVYMCVYACVYACVCMLVFCVYACLCAPCMYICVCVCMCVV